MPVSNLFHFKRSNGICYIIYDVSGRPGLDRRLYPHSLYPTRAPWFMPQRIEASALKFHHLPPVLPLHVVGNGAEDGFT